VTTAPSWVSLIRDSLAGRGTQLKEGEGNLLRFTRHKKATAIGGVVALLASVAGLLVLQTPAAHAGSFGTTLYEVDCTGTGLAAGNTAPFVVGLTINAAPDPRFPNGGAFGATGAFSTTVNGAFLANIEANVDLSAGSMDLGTANQKIQSTDGSATGSYSYSKASFGPQSLAGLVNQVPPAPTPGNVTWTAASSTLSGPFAATDVGKFVAAPLAAAPALGQGHVIVAVTPGVDATITGTTVSAQATGVTVGLASAAGLTYVDPTLSTGNVFSTNGVNGGQSKIGLAGTDGTTNASMTLTLPVVGAILFGGTPGGPACTQTGYAAGGTPSTPAPAIAPYAAYQGGGLANLVSVGPSVFAPAAFVNLVDPPPAAQNGNANVGTGGSSNIVLTATDGDATQANHFQLTTPGPFGTGGRLTVNITNPVTGATTLTDTGSLPEVVTFQFTACDDNPTNTNCDATPATITVNIGTPPVQQPINQLVNAGQLVLSCNAPGSVGYPLLTCPVINMPSITLNGLQQTTTAAMNPIYVSDNRGDLTLPWTLTAYMVPTPSVLGCTAANFCNSNVGANLALANNHIAATNLTLTPTALTGCLPHVGNLNAGATIGAGGTLDTPRGLCSAVGPNAGGTWDVNGQFSLNIPSSVAAGLYKGTVEYLVV
jgi:hypothetical protein